jgi:hypothetical protein
MAVTGQPAQTFFRGVLIARTTCWTIGHACLQGKRKEEQDKGCMTASRGAVKSVLTSRAMGGAQADARGW